MLFQNHPSSPRGCGIGILHAAYAAGSVKADNVNEWLRIDQDISIPNIVMKVTATMQYAKGV